LVIDEATGRLIGRGASDDKGPVLGWVNVLQYHHGNKKELPVNLVCCFEGMEESGSEGLDALVEREAQPGGWFDGVDAVCIVRISILKVFEYLLTLIRSQTTTG
jgi:Cys-Gly metallodipeptidase DUG1